MTSSPPEVGPGSGNAGSCPTPPPLACSITNDDPLSFEQKHVHQVYEAIAPHFSATRYKAWPKVREFVEELQPGAILVDVGCGNGKNLCLAPHVFAVGCDRSRNLVKVAQGQNLEAFECDALSVPIRGASCDAAISIAVIHHFATEARRCAAVSELMRLVRPGGLILIYVWAREQAKDRGGSDVMIRWQMHDKFDNNSTVHHRYYHLFQNGELEQLCRSADAVGQFDIMKSYFDKENWCVVLRRALGSPVAVAA